MTQKHDHKRTQIIDYQIYRHTDQLKPVLYKIDEGLNIAEWVWLPLIQSGNRHEKPDSRVNQYVEFRHVFRWSPNRDKQLHQTTDLFEDKQDKVSAHRAAFEISCDSDYSVWINQTFAACGQYDDIPDHKVYDSFDVSDLVQNGENILSVRVYYQGEVSNNYYPGRAGLIYRVYDEHQSAASGEETVCRLSQAYQSGTLDKNQFGFSFIYQSSREDDWMSEQYKTNDGWHSVYIDRERKINNPDLYPRPIKKLKIKEPCDSKIVAQGLLRRPFNNDLGDMFSFKTAKQADHESTAGLDTRAVKKMPLTIAQQVQTDYLSARLLSDLFEGSPCQQLKGRPGLKLRDCVRFKAMQEHSDEFGFYLIIDLGREEAGFVILDLEAPQGLLIDIAYGEHLDDLRVRSSVGGRNFAHRYITKQGRQFFIHTLSRIGCRYIQLHMLFPQSVIKGDLLKENNISEPLVIYQAGLCPTDYPIERTGQLSLSDLMHEKIHQVAVRSLHLCMHEHYEDCVWREQALYAMDSRIQALCGYYVFGEYDFPQASFELLAMGQRPDGMLELTMPSKTPFTIPSFSLAWVIEMAEFYLFSGRLEAVANQLPVIKAVLNSFNQNTYKNLTVTHPDPDYWHFYEWSDDLSGEPIIRDKVLDFRVDAPLNAFLCLALDGASMIARACDDAIWQQWEDQAEKIRQSFHSVFWDDESALYQTYYPAQEPALFSELTQALAVCAGFCDTTISDQLRQVLADKQSHLVPATLSHSIFKYEALMGDAEKYGQFVMQAIADNWGHMLLGGASSFWETIKGADDFAKAGSLCHGWSAVPIYFYYAYVLGVKPVKPGFEVYSVSPFDCGFYAASGAVPTPYGDIHVEWNRHQDDLLLDVKAPTEIKQQSIQ